MGFITIDRGPIVLCPLHSYRGSASTRKIEPCGSSVPCVWRITDFPRIGNSPQPLGLCEAV